MTDDMHITDGGIRPEPGEEPPEDEVDICCRFLNEFCPESTKQTEFSYRLKHIVENWSDETDYISNGALIEAAYRAVCPDCALSKGGRP